MIDIYTDGSSLGNPGPAGWGVLIIDEKINEFSGGTPNATNNQMELQAVIEALQIMKTFGRSETEHSGVGESDPPHAALSSSGQAHGLGLFETTIPEDKLITEEVRIHTDSEYVQKGVEERLEKWIARGWRVQNRNQPIKNIEQRQTLHGLLGYFPNLSWKWVKGHAGHQYNELVDSLARRAAIRYM